MCAREIESVIVILHYAALVCVCVFQSIHQFIFQFIESEPADTAREKEHAISYDNYVEQSIML